MKRVFVGPSLPDAAAVARADIEIRPPAIQGDILAAVKSGACAIGLIDGNFESVAPVWHKEILFALSMGVQVLGAASMGALRAAECAAFGMVGVGEIYEGYVSGRLFDDADVALLHGPPELDWIPLTIPIVNVTATLDWLSARDRLSAHEVAALAEAAGRIFYKDRTWAGIVEQADLTPSTERVHLLQMLRSSTVNAKASDARLLLDRLAAAPSERSTVQLTWEFHATSMWSALGTNSL
ncbi:TfuA-like protein [Rhizobium tubonense]|uniref:Antibiotic resistance protein n=1 Tax=Rhizobium tubonense TaxID=484088 RepID=A0A2W4EPW0_9HYPH|nr:TfuA-like protein [Rhizobium tubonense]PZM15546.1 antibiotic resistance protein [Rhizobium tubonense]